MSKKVNIQDSILNYLRKNQVNTTLFLMNGVKIGGEVKGFDSFIVIVEDNNQQKMIYKHAISTIVPSEPVPVEELTSEENA